MRSALRNNFTNELAEFQLHCTKIQVDHDHVWQASDMTALPLDPCTSRRTRVQWYSGPITGLPYHAQLASMP